MSNISIQNLYHMLCYAWGVLDSVGSKRVSSADFSTPLDIIAEELCRNSSALVRKRIALEFVTSLEKTQRPRGRIDFTRTVGNPEYARRNLYCIAPEITVDRLENQILKASFKEIRQNASVSKLIRQEAYALESRLASVKNVRVTRAMFQRVKRADLPSAYKLPLAICELMHFGIAPKDVTGSLWFEEFVRDETRMRRVFETFLRNFFLAHINNGNVGARRFFLSGVNIVDGEGSLIPNLNADVVIDLKSGPKIVLDAKFSTKPLMIYHGKEMLRSEHLYQILTYVSNIRLLEPGRDVHGLVIYPKSDIDLDITFTYAGAHFRFMTIDLSADWQQVEFQLLNIVTQIEAMPSPIAKLSKGGTALPIILA